MALKEEHGTRLVLGRVTFNGQNQDRVKNTLVRTSRTASIAGLLAVPFSLLLCMTISCCGEMPQVLLWYSHSVSIRVPDWTT